MRSLTTCRRRFPVKPVRRRRMKTGGPWTVCGFAPSDNPQIAIATRIAFGYGSGNACDFADTVMKYYFQEASEEELLNGQAANVGTSSGGFAD